MFVCRPTHRAPHQDDSSALLGPGPHASLQPMPTTRPWSTPIHPSPSVPTPRSIPDLHDSHPSLSTIRAQTAHIGSSPHASTFHAASRPSLSTRTNPSPPDFPALVLPPRRPSTPADFPPRLPSVRPFPRRLPSAQQDTPHHDDCPIPPIPAPPRSVLPQPTTRVHSSRTEASRPLPTSRLRPTPVTTAHPTPTTHRASPRHIPARLTPNDHPQRKATP